jgi:hypothetical protein
LINAAESFNRSSRSIASLGSSRWQVSAKSGFADQGVLMHYTVILHRRKAELVQVPSFTDCFASVKAGD